MGQKYYRFYGDGDSVRFEDVPIGDEFLWRNERFTKIEPQGRAGKCSRCDSEPVKNARALNGRTVHFCPDDLVKPMVL